MSMFPIHYLIRRGNKYWNGGPAHEDKSWSGFPSGVGFYREQSAINVLNGVLKDVKDECEIEEDE